MVKATIDFNDYIKCLYENVILTRQQRNIRSRHHQLYSEKEYKIALSVHDDKRYLLSGTTDMLPWGHYRVVEEQANKEAGEGKWSRRIPQR